MTLRPVRAAALVIAAAVLAVTGCSEGQQPASGVDPRELTGDLTVLAAASLTRTFTELGEVFEQQNPGVTVSFSFAGSSGLAGQVASGAPADVFAAASPQPMATAVEAGAVEGDAEVFARNLLQVVVPAGNPGRVTGLADLADPDLTVALCAPEVPCGEASEKVFAAAGLTPAPDTLEQDVKAVLTKVELGEVDAALVYRTDVLSAGDAVVGIDVPEAEQAVNAYLLAVLSEAPNPRAATAFVELVLAQDGQEVLIRAGFQAP